MFESRNLVPLGGVPLGDAVGKKLLVCVSVWHFLLPQTAATLTSLGPGVLTSSCPRVNHADVRSPRHLLGEVVRPPSPGRWHLCAHVSATLPGPFLLGHGFVVCVELKKGQLCVVLLNFTSNAY